MCIRDRDNVRKQQWRMWGNNNNWWWRWWQVILSMITMMMDNVRKQQWRMWGNNNDGCEETTLTEWGNNIDINFGTLWYTIVHYVHYVHPIHRTPCTFRTLCTSINRTLCTPIHRMQGTPLHGTSLCMRVAPLCIRVAPLCMRWTPLCRRGTPLQQTNDCYFSVRKQQWLIF